LTFVQGLSCPGRERAVLCPFRRNRVEQSCSLPKQVKDETCVLVGC